MVKGYTGGPRFFLRSRARAALGGRRSLTRFPLMRPHAGERPHPWGETMALLALWPRRPHAGCVLALLPAQ
jgi:hypothetical protein